MQSISSISQHTYFWCQIKAKRVDKIDETKSEHNQKSKYKTRHRLWDQKLYKVGFFKKAPLHREFRKLVNFGWRERKGTTFQLRVFSRAKTKSWEWNVQVMVKRTHRYGRRHMRRMIIQVMTAYCVRDTVPSFIKLSHIEFPLCARHHLHGGDSVVNKIRYLVSYNLHSSRGIFFGSGFIINSFHLINCCNCYIRW